MIISFVQTIFAFVTNQRLHRWFPGRHSHPIRLHTRVVEQPFQKGRRETETIGPGRSADRGGGPDGTSAQEDQATNPSPVVQEVQRSRGQRLRRQRRGIRPREEERRCVEEHSLEEPEAGAAERDAVGREDEQSAE